jgi:type IV pilus assembly protein PilV
MREAGALQRHSGFSLLETAIAMAIMAVGLSGLAALLIRTVSGTALSSQRTAAFWLAENLASQVQLNPAGLTALLSPNPQTPGCTAANACSPGAFAATGYAAWQAEVAAALPGGVGQVCRDQLAVEGRAGGLVCAGSGPIVIKISWSSPGGTEQHVRVLQP